jgi:hypothetical protein
VKANIPVSITLIKHFDIEEEKALAAEWNDQFRRIFPLDTNLEVKSAVNMWCYMWAFAEYLERRFSNAV